MGDESIQLFPNADHFLHKISGTGLQYLFATSLLAGELIPIRHFAVMFTLLGLHILPFIQLVGAKKLVADIVWDFIRTTQECNKYIHIYIGSVTPQPAASDYERDLIKKVNWITGDTVSKAQKKGFNVFFVPLHIQFFGSQDGFKRIETWFQKDKRTFSKYGAYWLRRMFLEEARFIKKVQPNELSEAGVVPLCPSNPCQTSPHKQIPPPPPASVQDTKSEERTDREH